MPPNSLLRPAELPPFELRELVHCVFDAAAPQESTSSSEWASPTPGSSSVGSRLSQFVQNTRTGATSGDPRAAGRVKAAVARAVDGEEDTLWVGASDGRARTFRLRARRKVDADPRPSSEADPISPLSPSRRSTASPSSRSTGSRSSRGKGKEREIQVDIEAECVGERQLVTPADGGKPRAVERLVLIPKLRKAIVLSDGVVTIHSLPSLAPLPTSAFLPIRGVSAFTVDEDEISNSPSGSRSADGQEITLCVIRRRSIHLFRLRDGGMGQVRDVSLASSAFHGVLRGSALLLADIEQYYIVSLIEASMTPLLPISQVPLDPAPTSSGRATPAHRPAIAAIPLANEFIFASHTGSTCLGVFVNSRGEPSRGTIEWPSNPRSIVVVGQHVLALLLNGTVEVHTLANGEIAQVVSLPDGLDARNLACVPAGVTISGARSMWKVKTVSIPLYAPQLEEGPPRTPPPRNFHRRLESASSAGFPDDSDLDSSIAHALVLGKDSVHALTPLTLVAQAEALMSRARWDEAVALARQFAGSAKPTSSLADGSSSLRDQVSYVLQKAASHYLAECRFEEAGWLWLEGQGDPRIFVRLLPHLRAGSVARRDQVVVFRGIEKFLCDGLSAEALVTANLVRNYSPHIKPNVDSASSTISLKTSLLRKADEMVKHFLIEWRQQRLFTRGEDEGRKIDMVVDTALAELYAGDEPSALHALLEEPNDCVLAELDQALLQHERYATMTEVYQRRGQMDKVLRAWKRFVDGEWTDPAFSDGLVKIVDHLRTSDDAALLEQYVTWLARDHASIALELLASAKVAAKVDVRAMLDELRKIDEATAEAYLLHVVARKPSADTDLLSELVSRWIVQLKACLRDVKVAQAMRELADAYAAGGAGQSSGPSFLVALRAALRSTEGATGTALSIRLLLALFLPYMKPSSLTELRKDVEGMGGNEAAFAFERAIVYGKLGLHRPALSLLASTLRDFTSAEIYCIQDGNVIIRSEAASTAAALNLKLPFLEASKRRKTVPSSAPSSKAELLAILFDLGMASTNAEETATSAATMTGLLQRHALHLPIARLLPSLNPAWPLDSTLTTYFIRSLRKIEHERGEAELVKAVSMGQEMEWELRVAEARAAMGGSLQTEGGMPSGGDATSSPLVRAQKAVAGIIGQKLGDAVEKPTPPQHGSIRPAADDDVL